MINNTNLNSNANFFSLINNSSENFISKEELIDLHTKALLLESNIKLRKDMEVEYSKLKIEELNEDIEETLFQKKHLTKRNNDIISSLSKDDFESYDFSYKSIQAKEKLEKRKKQFQNYLDSQLPVIKNEFDYLVQCKNNFFLAEKAIEENKIRQNEVLLDLHNDFYKKQIMENTKLIDEIKQLKKRNVELQNQIEKKDNYYNTLQIKLKSELKGESLNNLGVYYYDNNEEESDGIINEEIKNDSEKYSIKEEKENYDYEEKNLRGRKKEGSKGGKYPKYVLNNNHIHGKLDDIKQKELDKINKQNEEKYRSFLEFKGTD